MIRPGTSKQFFAGLIFCLLYAQGANAQSESEYTYYPVSDPLVAEKLETWQDLKFGLLMHWGAYSQWGIVESWSICPEDYPWCRRTAGTNPDDYFAYLKEYEDLQYSFNPVQFDPGKWANAAAEAGMKYLVFTTKHHDGFCMWDTRETDYKITSKNTPFHSHEKADVTRAIFDAFRGQGLWTGAYFSKPDWHSEYFWWPRFPPKDRNANYSITTYPERWEQFVQFTHRQVMELMSDYGQVDILWLDGGWVKRRKKEDVEEYYRQAVENSETGFLKENRISQDIRMDELAAKAREKQPGLIVVDRAVEGPNQNYLTPENTVPEKALPYPWESCIISGGGWSWVDPEKAHYKSVRETIHMLADIVSKGGNLLLNIAPGPHGDWHDDAYALLEGIGKWLDVNGEAIYDSRAISPYKSGKVCYTQKGDDLFAIYLADEGENHLPIEILLQGITIEDGSAIYMLGHTDLLQWRRADDGIRVAIPDEIKKHPASDDAWVLKIEGM